jgi:HSP20 family molecular chaperone IbpA
MTQIAIEKITGNKPVLCPTIDELEHLRDQIQENALRYYQARHGQCECSIQDWLRAERGLVIVPQSELIENDDEFQLRVNLAGFDADDVAVTALPNSLIVKASSGEKRGVSEGEIQFSEFEDKTTFRRFDFSTTVNVDKVMANLEKGILRVTAPKATQKAAPRTKALAA